MKKKPIKKKNSVSVLLEFNEVFLITFLPYYNFYILEIKYTDTNKL